VDVESQRAFAFASIVCLTIGSMIYLCFRSESLLMFQWAHAAGLSEGMQLIRDGARPFRQTMPSWFNYSLPYSLWVLSYMFAQRAIWHDSHDLGSCLWILSIPILAITSEVAQALQIIPGTFDWVDLAMLAIAAIIGTIACLMRNSYSNGQQHFKASGLSHAPSYFHRSRWWQRRN